MSLNNINYRELGLKVGLEFHQRLDTHKLFCNCDSDGEEESYLSTTRKLRPKTGELGEIDKTAMLEFARDKNFKYQSFSKSSCLVELDEEPPHRINEKAIDIAIEISRLLECSVPDELQVMRKTVIDGSNTSGFQRTMLIGDNGFIKTKFGKVGILGVFLEEEACGIVEEKKSTKTYRLDRLGIPLVEIATGIMEFEPKQIQETALEIGILLRMTGKVKRGLGTIRQDVNISIKNGARIEAKGLQDIKLLDKVIEYEASRQINLLKLKEEFKERKIKKQKVDIQSFTSFFDSTKCKMIKTGLDKGLKVHGIVFPNFKGIFGFELSIGKRFGSELAGIAKTFGLNGLIHTDEDLKKYEIEKEISNIYKKHNLKEDDSLMLMIGEPEQMRKALEEIINRINIVENGVPNETRKVLDDGNTQFMRYLSGAHRMYPETDIPPARITKERIAKIEKELPEKPEEVFEKLMKNYGLGEELADKMITSRNLKLFLELAKMKVNPTLIASTLEETLVELRRQSVDIEKITEKHFKELFKLVEENKIAKEALGKMLTKIALNPEKKVSEIAREFETVSEDELKKYLDEIIKQNKELVSDKSRAFNILMGEMMKKYRGKADGALIAKIVKEKVK